MNVMTKNGAAVLPRVTKSRRIISDQMTSAIPLRGLFGRWNSCRFNASRLRLIRNYKKNGFHVHSRCPTDLSHSASVIRMIISSSCRNSFELNRDFFTIEPFSRLKFRILSVARESQLNSIVQSHMCEIIFTVWLLILTKRCFIIRRRCYSVPSYEKKLAPKRRPPY